jgi:hypothetical protein
MMFTSRLLITSCVACLLVLGTSSPSFAQVQGMKAFDNRLEGTKVHPNALLDFTLIAAHRSFTPFSANAVLHVRFYLPKQGGSTNKEVFVESAELQDSFHYSMQAKNSGKWKDGDWNVFEPWPTKDVIDKLGIQASNIGVLVGYRIGNSPPVYVPVEVYQNEERAKSGAYTFYFMTGQDLQSLEVSVTNGAGVVMKAPKLQLSCRRSFNPNCKLYAAGSVQPIMLDMSALPQGEYHIKLLGHIPGNLTPTSLDIVVYHHP